MVQTRTVQLVVVAVAVAAAAVAADDAGGDGLCSVRCLLHSFEHVGWQRISVSEPAMPLLTVWRTTRTTSLASSLRARWQLMEAAVLCRQCRSH